MIWAEQIVFDLKVKLRWCFFGLNPVNTLKSFQNIHLPEDMKNKRMLNPAEISPNDLPGLPLSKAGTRTEEGRRLIFVLRHAGRQVIPLKQLYPLLRLQNPQH